MSLHFDPIASATYGNVASFLGGVPTAGAIVTITAGALVVTLTSPDLEIELVEA